MPLGKVTYTLVGFATELDWRPVPFVEPLPSVRVCSACGLVRTKTAVLTCPHVLCESCYEQCTQDAERICPLDGLACPEKDVKWMDFPAEELLSKEVTCWNGEN
ncbi:hypothetical protein V5799_034006, partial [Amblyomma americanum]